MKTKTQTWWRSLVNCCMRGLKHEFWTLFIRELNWLKNPKMDTHGISSLNEMSDGIEKMFCYYQQWKLEREKSGNELLKERFETYNIFQKYFFKIQAHLMIEVRQSVNFNINSIAFKFWAKIEIHCKINSMQKFQKLKHWSIFLN